MGEAYKKLILAESNLRNFSNPTENFCEYFNQKIHTCVAFLRAKILFFLKQSVGPLHKLVP